MNHQEVRVSLIPPTHPQPPAAAQAQSLRYAVLASLWAALLFCCGPDFSSFSALTVFVLVLLVGLPILLSGLYLGSVRKIRNLAGFAAQGWLYRVLGGRVLLTIGWTLFAVVSSLFIWLQFRRYDAAAWAGLLALVPLFYLCWRLALRLVRDELSAYRQVAAALQLARWLTPLLALLVEGLVLAFNTDRMHFASLGDAIALARPAAAAPGASLLVHELSHWLAYYEGSRLFLASELAAQGPWWSFLVAIAGSWLFYFSATAMLACFLIPTVELRRIFAVLSDADQPPAPEFSRIVLTSALSVLVLLLILLPAFVSLESWARQHAAHSAERREQLDTVIVRIGEHYYRPQLIDELQALQGSVGQQLVELDAGLMSARARGFAAMTANVEVFLDWYYQLSAEYLRMAKLLSGKLEDYLASQLKECLLQDAPFAEYEQIWRKALAERLALRQDFEHAREALLEKHRLPAAEVAKSTRTTELSFDLLPTFPAESIPFALRSSAGTGVGAISGILVGKIVAKLYAKGALKLAAKPLAKMAAGRAATAAGGAATGAVMGSVVPGAGTLLGTALGGAIGLGVGILTDFGLLKLEEQLSRDELRQQILLSIEEVRQEWQGNGG